MSEANEPKKKLGIGGILRWVFGVLFILVGLSMFGESFLAGVCYLLGGVVLLPPTSKWLQANLNLKPALTVVIAVVFILAGGAFSGSSDTEGDAEEDVSVSSVEDTDDVEEDDQVSDTDDSGEENADEDAETEEAADEDATTEEEISEPVVVEDDEEAVAETPEDNEEASDEESHIYDDAEIVDMMNGSRTEVIGAVSVISALSSDITEEVLTDWYFNYVAETDYNYYLIVYTDIEDTGCYAFTGIVEANVTLEDTDGYGLYSLADDSNATIYAPTDEGTLSVMEWDDNTEQNTETQETSTSDEEAQTETIVYITETGSKYHRSNCRHLADSKSEISLSDAVAQGYEPCGTCNPPTK